MLQQEYVQKVCERINWIAQTEKEPIRQAAGLLADAICRDRLIYVFGAGGHTSLAVGEMFFRVGGLANIYPICEHGLSALSCARTFLALERCKGLGGSLIEASGLGKDDVLLVIHTIGVNASCIDAALKAKELGANVIGIASFHWQDETPQGAVIRHESGKNLRDVADIFVDDGNTVADAVLNKPALKTPVGPVSGIGTFALCRIMELEAIDICLERGIEPPIWNNANTPRGTQQNERLLARFSPRIPAL